MREFVWKLEVEYPKEAYYENRWIGRSLNPGPRPTAAVPSSGVRGARLQARAPAAPPRAWRCGMTVHTFPRPAIQHWPKPKRPLFESKPRRPR